MEHSNSSFLQKAVDLVVRVEWCGPLEMPTLIDAMG